MADKIIYTSTIDKFFAYQFGELEYRSLRFEIEKLNDEPYYAFNDEKAKEMGFERCEVEDEQLLPM